MKRLAAINFLIAFAIVLFDSPPCLAQQQNEGAAPKAAQSKPVLIGVKVEAEGQGKGQGMWDQIANDFTLKEVEALQALVVAELKKQGDVKIVPFDYPGDCIDVAVVGAKLPSRNGKPYYIVSSVLTAYTKEGANELVTHDVIAEYDLASLARAIAYQFAVARFRGVIGIWK